MTIQVEPSRARWWRRYADRVHRRPEDVDEIIRSAAHTPNPFPHVRMRLVLKKPEAYLPGTGLSVWEVAWLARLLGNEAEAIAEHLSIDAALVDEALRYASANKAEIDPAIRAMEEASEESLRAILPGMTVSRVDAEPKNESMR